MDPRCPDCDQPVGATATSCMHCGAEFHHPANIDVEDAMWTSSTETAVQAPNRATSDKPDSTDIPSTLDRWVPLWLARVVSGLLIGPVLALWTLLIIGTIAGGTAGFVSAVVVWFVTAAYWKTRRSVTSISASVCYGVALLLAFTPVIVLTDAAKGGTFGGQVLLFIIAEGIFGIIAVGFAGIGYRLTQAQSEVLG